MYHDLPRDASFWAFLFSIDRDLAESTRQKACPCGGCLHRANYPRNRRGSRAWTHSAGNYRLLMTMGGELLA